MNKVKGYAIEILGAILVLAAVAAFATWRAEVTAPPAPAPAKCEVVAPGTDGAEVNGQDFYAWRDYVSEDGTLDYSPDGDWTFTTWDGEVKTLGYASVEDGTIYATRSCAASQPPYER